MCSVEISAVAVAKEVPEPPRRSLFSSGQPCVHLAPKVRTNINKPLQNGEIKTSNGDRQDRSKLTFAWSILSRPAWPQRGQLGRGGTQSLSDIVLGIKFVNVCKVLEQLSVLICDLFF